MATIDPHGRTESPPLETAQECVRRLYPSDEMIRAIIFEAGWSGPSHGASELASTHGDVLGGIPESALAPILVRTAINHPLDHHLVRLLKPIARTTHLWDTAPDLCSRLPPDAVAVLDVLWRAARGDAVVPVPEFLDRYLSEFAICYNKKHKAERLLIRAGFPMERAPRFRNPLKFWTAVSVEIGKGCPGGLEILLRFAAKDFPENDVFKGICREGG